MAKVKNENESLNAKIACLEVENKTLHDISSPFPRVSSIALIAPWLL